MLLRVLKNAVKQNLHVNLSSPAKLEKAALYVRDLVPKPRHFAGLW